MTLLVTGGAGFIGSNFVRLVLRKRPNWRVINLDRLTYSGNVENLCDVEETEGGKRYFFIEGDICNASLVAALLRGEHPILLQGNFKRVKSLTYPITAVINFAAESHVDRSILDASPFYRTNLDGTRVLIESTREYWKTDRLGSASNSFRFLQISTDEVYGSLETHDFPFTEQSPLRPNSPYAASKAAADLTVLAYVRTFDVPAMISRCGNNYGPYQHPEKFIPLLITNTLEGRSMPLYGDGLQVRDWIYVLDHCNALLSILEYGTIGEIYNIGARQEHTNLEVAELIAQKMRKSHEVICNIPDRPGHDRRYALEVKKIQSELGWKARYSFAQRLNSTILWYRNHSDWWKRLKNEEFWNYYKEVYGSN